jgi:hypothetical protein
MNSELCASVAVKIKSILPIRDYNYIHNTVYAKRYVLTLKIGKQIISNWMVRYSPGIYSAFTFLAKQISIHFFFHKY